MLQDLSLVIVGLAPLGLCLLALAAWRLAVQRRALRSAEAERDRALAAEDTTNRALRMAGSELRNSALALLGHADRLRAGGQDKPGDGQAAGGSNTAHATAIHVVSAQIFGLADELQDLGVPSPESRVLHVEPLRLDEPIREAMAAVEAALGPSRRNWAIDPELGAITVQADRRALTQVFLRVLANAARFSRHDDRVAITRLAPEPGGGITVVVADAATVADMAVGMSGGGVGGGDELLLGVRAGGTNGLGLAMARVLMQAHGGELHVAAVPRFGTCVTIRLPASRVHARLPQTVG